MTAGVFDDATPMQMDRTVPARFAQSANFRRELAL